MKKNSLPAFLLLTANCLLQTFSFSQCGWNQKDDFDGTARAGAVGFSIGAKGYIGTGVNINGQYEKDFWEWDQTANVWTQMADYGGIATSGAVGFSIGTKGYIGTGSNNGGLEFYEWNQVSNTWSKKADFGGTARVSAVGFSIGTKGYIGTGYDGSSYRKDFWEWDQASNTWLQRSDFGGSPTFAAVGFSIGGKGYIGTGRDGSTSNKVFWEYDPSLNIMLTTSTQDVTCYQGSNGSATVTVTGSTPPYTYLWSNGQTTFTATGLSAGNYTITVVNNGNSCTKVAVVTISEPPIVDSIPICLVTVDSLSQYNIIVWEKPANAPIDSFIIYREISLNNYQPIGAVFYDSLSWFVDTVRTKYFPNTGDPNGGTYRYKLQVRDTCGNYSSLSQYHNTIFMTNSSGNFSWAQLYTIEGSSNPVNSYVLMRDDNNNGNWNAINSVSGTQQNVTDPAYATWAATANWRISTLWGISCTPTTKNPVPMGTINTSKSNNLKITAPVSVNEVSLENFVSILPNPNNGEFNIQSPKIKVQSLEVYNVYGEKVHSEIAHDAPYTVHCTLSNGIYFVHIKTERGTAVKKIVAAY